MGYLFKILRAKFVIAKNNIYLIQKDSSLRIVFVGGLGLFLCVSGLCLLWKGFEFLQDFSPFGSFLVDRLSSFYFLCVFIMLVFSSFIASFPTIFSKEESGFLHTLPIEHWAIFFARMFESAVLISWSFFLLSLPFVLARGLAASSPIWFYPFGVVLIVMFLLVSCLVGSILTLCFSRFFSPKKKWIWMCGMSLLSIPILIIAQRLGGLRGLAREGVFNYLSGLMDALQFTSIPILPSHWISEGLRFASIGDLSTSFFYLLLFLSNVFFLSLIAKCLSSRFYYDAWTRAQAGGSGRVPGRRFHPFWVPKPILNRVSSFTLAHLVKDAKIFFRTPTQWVQCLIFFGILLIHVFNLRHIPPKIDVLFWKGMIVVLNTLAIGLILAMLTTRFIFPLFSLEGGRFWIIGFSPVSTRRIFLEKFFFGLGFVALITEGLVVLLNIELGLSFIIFLLTSGTVFLMSIVLVGLSVALGAIFPNFKERSPARIVSGLGGTINAILALLVVCAMVGVEAIPIHLLYMTGEVYFRRFVFYCVCALIFNFLITSVIVILLSRFAFRSIDRMEF